MKSLSAADLQKVKDIDLLLMQMRGKLPYSSATAREQFRPLLDAGEWLSMKLEELNHAPASAPTTGEASKPDKVLVNIGTLAKWANQLAKPNPNHNDLFDLWSEIEALLPQMGDDGEGQAFTMSEQAEKHWFGGQLAKQESATPTPEPLGVATQTPWVSVQDRLPQERGSYIVANKRGVVSTEWYSGMNRYFLVDAGISPDEVTHWMPLPTPPKSNCTTCPLPCGAGEEPVERQPNNFCEVAEQKCYHNYCDENGCQDRKRHYTPFGLSLLTDNDLVRYTADQEEGSALHHDCIQELTMRGLLGGDGEEGGQSK